MNEIFTMRKTNVYLGSPTDSNPLKLLDVSTMGWGGHRSNVVLGNLKIGG